MPGSLNRYADKRLKDLEEEESRKRLQGLQDAESGYGQTKPPPPDEDRERERRKQIAERLRKRQRTIDSK